ncbi:MAG TPA: YdbH domain-containing protein [Caulobacterales bacterium]|nr:YdbH domain-containing protein [Caulobacterales bacterium]
MSEGAPPQGRTARWPVRLGWAGAGAALLLGGVWLIRIPLAELTFRSVFAQQGVDAEADIQALDFGHALARNVRIGSPAAPDVKIDEAELSLNWRGLSPQLSAVRAIRPFVRLKLDPSGQISVGALEHFQTQGPSRRPSLGPMRIVVEDGSALIDAPFGALNAKFDASGVIGRDFQAMAWIAPTTQQNGAYQLEAAHAELIASSPNGQLALRLTAAAKHLAWNGLELRDAAFVGSAQAPADLSRAHAEALWRIAALDSDDGLSARAFNGGVNADAAMRADALAPQSWTGGASATAIRIGQADASLAQAQLRAEMHGGASASEGQWTLSGAHFTGFALSSNAPSARGTLRFAQGALQAGGDVTFANTRLTEQAQQDVRSWFPRMDGSPVGPTFAAARHALDAAMGRFDLHATAQLQWRGQVGQIVVASPIEARAASGARLVASPLRDDAPALTLQLPSNGLHVAASIETSGGGLPNATLLLDGADWAPDAPLVADGSLTLANWRSEGAEIAAQDLDLSLVQPPDGEGHLVVKGPARITGPLGDGDVRDLNVALDVTIAWERGWRVTPNQRCLPVRMSTLNVAALSFQSGAFGLCAATQGALIAADAGNRLSGGFTIQSLQLNGRMAPPDSQPARLRSSLVRGAFSGTTENIVLDVEAQAPSLAIDMARDRTLSVSGRRVTANARVADRRWRVDGLFESGELGDPTLPGDVRAIAGRWSMAPENDRVVIRVNAGEARLVAHAANADDPRPLFNPMRFADVDAVLDSGKITANGRLVLEAGGRELARFSAEHDVDAGVGAAHVNAPQITFDQHFQPYEITELARGLVDNVRGPVSATAEIQWGRDTLTATGHVRPEHVSLAMATIPVIQDVSGDVYFDDLLQLTTPPGQALTVGLINPGVEVHNGRLRFQLLPDQHVAIEQADFDFSSGTLSVAPTTIALGAEETRFELKLRDIDIATLIDQLDFGDLHATGRVQGSFPLLLTTRTAFIENGQLETAPGGGTISYVGQAGNNTGGAAEVAFDALKSFHYDNLALTLNGDISGDVVTTIRFTGVNTGKPVNLAPISPVPGVVGELHARGVPFRFNVTVTAPFRRLAEAASTITNPQSLLHQAQPQGQNPPVDQEPPAQR